MAHVHSDRVADTTTTTGIGAVTLSGSPPTGYRTFSAVMATNDTCYYAIASATSAEWEVGLGTYSASNTLTRTTVLASSNSNNAVNFSAGTKDVFITDPAARDNGTLYNATTDTAVAKFNGTNGNVQNSGVLIDVSNNVSGVGTLAAGTTTLTSSNANALAVGRQGTTSPALQVDASTATSATGLQIKAAASGGGLAISTLGGTNENLTINAKGTGTISLGSVSTGNILINDPTIITSSGANALTAGRQGTTSPAFNVDASTASSATGLNIKAAAAAGGVAVSALSSGTNESLTIDAKGTGVITLNNTATGAVTIGTTTNSNTSKLVVAGTISETVGSTQYLTTSQYDVGTASDQVPLNQYLGSMAYVDSPYQALDVGTGITTGSGTICKAHAWQHAGMYLVRILIDLRGLTTGGATGDIIGVNGTALPCYIALMPSQITVLGGTMTCLEAPATGSTDFDLYYATEGTGVEDGAIASLTETEVINAGVQTRGTVTYFSANPPANTYLYLVGQSTLNGTYTAGRILIQMWGY